MVSFARPRHALASLALLAGLVSVGANGAAVANATPVSVPTINILCRFSTQDPTYGTPTDTTSAADIQAQFGDSGLSGYFAEQSYGAVDLTGTHTVGWYTLPSPLTTYMPNNNIRQDYPRLATASTSAAEADVNFTPYQHINLFFNDLRVGSYTVTPFEQTHDGVTRIWPTSFLGGDMRTNPSIIAHEMGHSFGMAHASPDDCDPLASSAMYQPLGPGYLAYHRDVAGWIPAQRKADLSTRSNVTLTQLTQPNATDSLVAYYALPNGDKYSVEYRRKVGFDSSLPDEGVLINRITPGQGFDATLQSAGGGTGYEAMLWRPNEAFYDAANHFKLRVASVAGGRAEIRRVLGTLPNPPSNVRRTAQTTTSLAIAWNDNSSDESSILVRWRPTGSTASWQFAKLPAHNTSYTATGLAPATSYDVTVQTCQGGIDDCGAEATATLGTSGPPPARPTNLHAEQNTAHGLTLRWVDNATNESSYEVRLGESTPDGACLGPQVVTLGPNATSATFTGLVPSRTYCASVTVVNGGGWNTTGYVPVSTPAS